MSNIAAALTGASDLGLARATARRSLRNFFRSFVEILLAVESSEAQMLAEITIVGREFLDAALAKGRGVILLSAHMGNFFLIGARLAIDGHRSHIFVSPPRYQPFAQWMDNLRSRVRQQTIRARPRRAAIKTLHAVLRRNEIVIVIADEYRYDGGIPVTLFGGTVSARRGPATLALRTGAAIVPAYLIRQPDDSLKLIIEPELELARTHRDAEAVREGTLRITRWLERTVSAYPDQWNWTNIEWNRDSRPASAAKEPGLQRVSH